MAGNNVMLDFDEWDQHAQWWDQEADPRIHFHKLPNPWKPT